MLSKSRFMSISSFGGMSLPRCGHARLNFQNLGIGL
jgi:hypothetical protein